MKKNLLKYLNICWIGLLGQIFASTGGVVGVFSPRLMYDGRPILWQNLDSDLADVSIQFFQGERYNFFGLLNGEDSSRVYAGLNTAGFAIVFSKLKEATPDSLIDQEAILAKQALGECGRLEDFDRLLDSTAIRIGANSSFACIDAYGAQKIYQSGAKSRESLNLKDAPDGFFVRANFHFNDPQKADKSYWRYHRARELVANESAQRKLHHHQVVKKCARDLQSIAMDPYPLPYSGVSNGAPAGYVQSENCLNQFNTVSCVVIHGVRSGENPDFSTMWVMLGEPICSIAVPLWPATSQVPPECQPVKRSLNNLFQENKRALYDQKNSPQNLNSNELKNLESRLNPIENQVFVETRKALSLWREKSNYLQDMIDFQMMTVSYVYRSEQDNH